MNWLQELKPGVKVIVRGGPTKYDYVRSVKRLTKTLIILNTGQRYRKIDGRQVASAYSFYNTRLCNGSSEEMAKILIDEKNRNLLTDVINIDFNKLNSSQLEQIIEISRK